MLPYFHHLKNFKKIKNNFMLMRKLKFYSSQYHILKDWKHILCPVGHDTAGVSINYIKWNQIKGFGVFSPPFLLLSPPCSSFLLLSFLVFHQFCREDFCVSLLRMRIVAAGRRVWLKFRWGPWSWFCRFRGGRPWDDHLSLWVSVSSLVKWGK